MAVRIALDFKWYFSIFLYLAVAYVSSKRKIKLYIFLRVLSCNKCCLYPVS